MNEVKQDEMQTNNSTAGCFRHVNMRREYLC